MKLFIIYLFFVKVIISQYNIDSKFNIDPNIDQMYVRLTALLTPEIWRQLLQCIARLAAHHINPTGRPYFESFVS